MPLEFLRRHAPLALYHIEQGFHPVDQGGLGGFKDGPGPEAELLATAAAGAGPRGGCGGHKTVRSDTSDTGSLCPESDCARVGHGHPLPS